MRWLLTFLLLVVTPFTHGAESSCSSILLRSAPWMAELGENVVHWELNGAKARRDPLGLIKVISPKGKTIRLVVNGYKVHENLDRLQSHPRFRSDVNFPDLQLEQVWFSSSTNYRLANEFYLRLITYYADLIQEYLNAGETLDPHIYIPIGLSRGNYRLNYPGHDHVLSYFLAPSHQ